MRVLPPHLAWLRHPSRPLVFGHRGCRDGVENTLGAFEAAAQAGADGIELDVRSTRCGRLVAFHDPTLERVTNARRTEAIADLDYDELLGVELGDGARIALIDDVIEWARENRVVLNVEMKRDVPDRTVVVRATARALARQPTRAIVSSFDPFMLTTLRWLAPSIPRAQLVHRSYYQAAMFRTRIASAAHALHVNHELIDLRLMDAYRRRAVISAWTVNEPDEARRLAALGVDSIITDEPGRILRALSGPQPAPMQPG